MITVAALSPSLDITYVVDQLRLGEIHRPTEVHRVAGGKSLNLARAATAVGAPVQTIALLGGSTGDFLESELRREGIGVRRVDSPTETRTCVSIGSAAGHELTELYPYAPAIPDAAWQEFRRVFAEELSAADGWLAINGSVPDGPPADALAALTRLAIDAGLEVAIDSHGPALAGVLEARPQLIKVNRYEAAELLGRDPDRAEVAELAKIISARTGGSVIITDGRAGAVFCSVEAGTVRAELPADVSGHYPVGSGDSFLGGWLAATDRGADPADALRLATGCGAANALIPGPGLLDRRTARQIADRTVLSRLS
ncbi:1-phosphofructokinase family hexose kinase [Microlunatus elymi]|uniref:1-phosphofructokinase family hexose kinase n=1 Tax=Microlunatus elymi TaxID=2596828 RepID=UPI00143D514C|nr:PfkB family carbohydrate kinase [Microlunatus elymi]